MYLRRSREQPPIERFDETQSGETTTDSQPAKLLTDPALQTNTFQSKFEVYSYVAGFSGQEIANELQRVVSLSNKVSHRILRELQVALLERLVAFNPLAAKEIALAQDDVGSNSLSFDSWSGMLRSVVISDSDFVHMPLVQGVFREWALSDLDAAVSNAKSLNDDARKNALAGVLSTQSGKSLAIHRKIAKELGHEQKGVDSYVSSYRTAKIENPRATWDQITNLIYTDSYDPYEVVTNIAKQWYERDGIYVVELINAGSSDDSIKETAVDAVLSAAAKVNPQEAFQYAQTLPSDGFFSGPLRSVIVPWASSDPQAAYVAATNVHQSGQRESLQRTLSQYGQRMNHTMCSKIRTFFHNKSAMRLYPVQ